MTSRSRSLLVATIGLAFLAGCGEHASPRRYNVLLVSLDTVRGDLLGCYGHRPRHAPGTSTSPNLDALAAAGVRMQDAYAPSSWTLPSHVSMMTGQTPLVHGIDTDEQALDGRLPTLADILHGHGYRTAGVFSGPYLESMWGFGRGFDRYRACYGPAATRAVDRLAALETELARARTAGDRVAEAGLTDEAAALRRQMEKLWLRDVTSPHVTAGALEEIAAAEAANAPWFVFAHYFDPHEDYVPPPAYRTRFDPDYPGSLTGKHLLANPLLGAPDPADPHHFVRRVSDRDLEHEIALYEGEIGWVDAHVGRLLRALDDREIAANTLVVVTSDHGEEFFEHGRLGHHHTLYDEVLRVPLVLRLPGVLPAGKTVGGLVSTADILPTVLDVLGLSAPDGWSGGRSFLPLIHGREDPARRDVFARLVTFETGTATIDGQTSVAARKVTVDEVFRRGSIKIRRTRAWPQFGAAPATAMPALEAEAEAQFRNELLTWVDVDRFPSEDDAHRSATFPNGAAADALRAFQAQYGRSLSASRPAARAQVAPHVASALRALGYVGDAGGARPMDMRLPLPGESGPAAR
ncbi:MAG TPA: sulfatase [Gaiellaceae bacterium]|nr:sulfatase [Gaiellaceae bacterium]